MRYAVFMIAMAVVWALAFSHGDYATATLAAFLFADRAWRNLERRNLER